MVETPWTSPNLAENGSIGGPTYGCIGTSVNAWKAFDSDRSTTCTDAYVTYYSPYPVYLQSVLVSGFTNSNALKTFTLEASNDYVTWDYLGQYTTSTAVTEDWTAYLPTPAIPHKYFKFTWVANKGGNTRIFSGLKLQGYTTLGEDPREHIMACKYPSEYYIKAWNNRD